MICKTCGGCGESSKGEKCPACNGAGHNEKSQSVRHLMPFEKKMKKQWHDIIKALDAAIIICNDNKKTRPEKCITCAFKGFLVGQECHAVEIRDKYNLEFNPPVRMMIEE